MSRVKVLYADVDGNIGWQPGGRAPVRPNWDGLLPVPGDGRYEWDGFRDISEFPSAFNPLEGYVATANEFNAQEDSQFGYQWSSPMRKRRLDEVLTADALHSIQDTADLQNDVINQRSRELAEMVLQITGSKGKLIQRPMPADDPTRRRPDISLARAKLNWEPTIKLREGLQKTIEWFRSISFADYRPPTPNY